MMGEDTIKSRLGDLMAKIYSSPLRLAIFVFVGGFALGMSRPIGRLLFQQEPLRFESIVWGGMGALLGAIFVYVSYKMIIARTG